MMTEPFSPDGPKQILTDLCRLAAERVPAEEAIAAGFQGRNEAAEKTYQEAQEALTAHYEEAESGGQGRGGGAPQGSDRTIRGRARHRAAAI